MAAAHARQVGSERECPHPVVYSSLSCCSQNILPLSRPAAEAHISSSVGESFPGAAACAAYNALWGARVVTVHTSGHEREFGGIPAITYSRYPSLRRIQCSGSIMLPLHDLAGYTQLHGLRELVCSTFLHYDLFQLQHAQPLSQLEVLDFTRMQTAAGADNSLAALPRLRELNLRGSDLHAVPASLSSLTRLTRLSLGTTDVSDGWQHLPLQLEQLDLSNVELNATVPLQLTRLTRLTELDLSNNEELEDLDTLRLLSSLARLNLEDSRLSNAEFLEFPSALQWLSLEETELAEIPMALTLLTGLTSLDLTANQLEDGWQHLAGMQRLAHLRLVNCGCMEVPQVLSQLTALTSLNLGVNDIASGWQHVASMPQLESLQLFSCNLAAVPQALSQLTALTCLSMNFNSISSGWQHLAGMQHLACLSLRQCSLAAAVPHVFSQLTALTSLDLSLNPIASGWQHLASMQQLESLQLINCDGYLTAVPPVLSQLKALTSLDIDYNPIRSGWGHFAGMQQLASLSLKSRSLKAVPPVLAQLTALTSLKMSGSVIASGWQHLSHLTLLELSTWDPLVI